jgi:hypothetical protein
MDEFITLISTVGFPIAVTAFLLIYMKKALDSLTKAINDMNITQTKLIEHLDIIAKNGVK